LVLVTRLVYQTSKDKNPSLW